MSNNSPFALIVNPWVTDFKLYDEWAHPIGLYFLIDALTRAHYRLSFINLLKRPHNASGTRLYATGPIDYCIIDKPKEYEFILRQYKRYGLSESYFTEWLQSHKQAPDLICVGTTMTYWLNGVEETIACIRKVFPKTPIIVGGIAAILCPSLVHKKLKPYNVTIFTGELSTSLSIPNIHIGPHPSLSAALTLQSHLHHAPILTTIGCPMHCSYCASNVLSGPFTIRPLDLIRDEIDTAVRVHNIVNFSFYDDALLFQAQKNCIPLLEMIATHYPHINLHAPNGMHLFYIT